MSLTPTAAVATAGASPGAIRETHWHRIGHNAFPFIVLALLWELLAHLDMFPPRLFPPMEDVFATFIRLTAAGILPHHVLDTLLRPPIPGLAYAPLFLLWFGSGNRPAILLVALVSAFPVILNTWTGVKAVKEIWLRSAQAMGAQGRQVFWHVMLRGALPYILTGMRLGLAQAWRILVGVEMLSAVPWGLGWMIFGAASS
jgi:NitT/TauT family transport system permease protein